MIICCSHNYVKSWSSCLRQASPPSFRKDWLGPGEVGEGTCRTSCRTLAKQPTRLPSTTSAPLHHSPYQTIYPLPSQGRCSAFEFFVDIVFIPHFVISWYEATWNGTGYWKANQQLFFKPNILRLKAYGTSGRSFARVDLCWKIQQMCIAWHNGGKPA